MAIGNPFARDREGDTPRNVTVYKALTIITFLVNLVFTIMYTSAPPGDDVKHNRHTIYGASNHHLTPFTPSHVFTTIYWIVLFIGQIGYIWHLFSSTETHVKAASSVGSHFILFNLFQFAWVMLWTRSHYVLSEMMLVFNFFNLCAVYFRHSTTPRLIHISTIAMPLVWCFFAIFWNGAVMVHCHSFACRILSNITIWGFMFFGAFFLLVFKDYYVGFATAYMMAGLGVGQFFTKVIAFQWIFAFTIMSVVFLLTVIIAVPGIFGAEAGVEGANQHHHTAGADRERAPLLEDA